MVLVQLNLMLMQLIQETKHWQRIRLTAAVVPVEDAQHTCVVLEVSFPGMNASWSSRPAVVASSPCALVWHLFLGARWVLPCRQWSVSQKQEQKKLQRDMVT